MSCMPHTDCELKSLEIKLNNLSSTNRSLAHPHHIHTRTQQTSPFSLVHSVFQFTVIVFFYCDGDVTTLEYNLQKNTHVQQVGQNF